MVDNFAWIAPAVWGLASLIVVVIFTRRALPKRPTAARKADDLRKAA
jgi:hypothetical protein